MSQRSGATRRSMRRSRRGAYGVAISHPKHEVNVGGLMRSAFLYDAAFVATVGRRYEKQASDTPDTARQIPLHHYSDIEDLKAHLPHGYPLIGIELHEDAIPLDRFWHPPSALYLLGSEDHGLPPSTLKMCHQVVQIPSPREWSMNVAAAGTVLLAHRYMQGL